MLLGSESEAEDELVCIWSNLELTLGGVLVVLVDGFIMSASEKSLVCPEPIWTSGLRTCVSEVEFVSIFSFVNETTGWRLGDVVGIFAPEVAEVPECVSESFPVMLEEDSDLEAS